MTNAIKGAMVALASSLLVAVLFAYIFRIPIPLGGMIGPLGEVSAYGMAIRDVLKSVLMAWVFYGLFGGFVILPACGAITGVYVGSKYAKSENKNRMIVLWSSIIGAIPVLVLSTMDYIVGSW